MEVKPPSPEGWVAVAVAAITAIAGTLKGLTWLRSKKEEGARTLTEITHQQQQEVVADVRASEKELRDLYKEALAARDEARDLLTKVMIENTRLDAALQAMREKLDELEADNRRLRHQRDHYRTIAQGASTMVPRGLSEPISDELSEADEANSKVRSK